MTDYKAETERLIKFAEGNGSESAATAAVATATLYLAEQQRIANLIAYVDHEFHIFQADDSAFNGAHDLDGVKAARVQIHEGLGI